MINDQNILYFLKHVSKYYADEIVSFSIKDSTISVRFKFNYFDKIYIAHLHLSEVEDHISDQRELIINTILND